jgi:hypothetical protein
MRAAQLLLAPVANGGIMAKTVALWLGIGFVLVGIVGFVAPEMLGMHLSATHSVIHLVTGAVSIYFGTKGTVEAARIFCIAFGAVYALLGIGGFLFGSAGTPGVPGPTDDYLWKILPGTFEVGTSDHVVHILLGAVYLVAGFMTKRRG